MPAWKHAGKVTIQPILASYVIQDSRVNASLSFQALTEAMEQHQFFSAPSGTDVAAAEVTALAESLIGLVGVAYALVTRDRHVDLSGLNASAGLLCAKALDLPPSQGRVVRAKLALLRNDLDALSAALRAREAV